MLECSLDVSDFEKTFSATLSPFVANKVRSFDLRYQYLSEKEKEDCWRRAKATLESDQIPTAGSHRYSDWERGWGENALAMKESLSPSFLLPKYFNKIDIVRWKQEWIRPLSDDFEYRMFSALQYWVFDRYLRDCDSIYEFGCGTGHNLLRMREVNPSGKLWGLDWTKASQQVLEILQKTGMKNIFGYQFNFFSPDKSFELEPNSAVVTIAALEQTGKNFGPFVDYLLEKKPKIVIHIEPIAEMLDEKHPLDRLSIEYFKKRKYLDGLLTSLEALAAENKVRLIERSRTYIGSFFIEGYSVLIWKPL